MGVLDVMTHPTLSNHPNSRLLTPNSVVQVVYNDKHQSCISKPPDFTPHILHGVCLESRLETLKTFRVGSTSPPLLNASNSSEVVRMTKIVGGVIDDQPHGVQDRTSWFQLDRDIIYWNGATFSQQVWDDLIEYRVSKSGKPGDQADIERNVALFNEEVKHVMLRTDIFAAGHWQIHQFMSCFPNLAAISVLVGGMTVHTDRYGLVGSWKPLCVLVDMADKAQMDRVSSHLRTFCPGGWQVWEGVRRHTEEIRYDYRMEFLNSHDHWLSSDLRFIECYGCCRNLTQWNGVVMSLKQAHITDLWRRACQDPGRVHQTRTEKLVEATAQAEVEFPRYRQVFLLRIFDSVLDPIGLDEVIF